ncbi:MAG: iron-containing alcohol dehydrogenase [Firmicutes bacterium]|nr:iron-containing alcohol dehydrogenase [Bacillota bacterium]
MTTENLLSTYGIQNAPPVYYGTDALKALRELTRGNSVLVVSDENSIRAGALSLAHIAVCDTVIFDGAVFADEKSVNQVRQSLQECDLIVAVGSKTVTDIAKYAAAAEELPFISVPTSASSGTYVSEFAELNLQKKKRAVKCRAAAAVVADSSILLKSPAMLKAAGLAVLMALAAESIERRAGALIYSGDFGAGQAAQAQTGELRTAAACFKEVGLNSLNSDKGMLALFGALCAAQSHKENTPGSAGFTDSAKLIANFFSAVTPDAQRGCEGETLGLSLHIVRSLIPALCSRIRSRISLTPSFSFKAWEQKINAVYPAAIAADIVAAEKKSKYKSAEQRQKRIASVYAHAPAFLKQLSAFDAFDAWFSLYEREGGITAYKKLGFTVSLVKNAALFAKDMTDGFSFLQLASDLNIVAEWLKTFKV